MRRYWQRRPLLVRQALAGFSPPIEPASLFALARREEVESRLVTAFNGWRLEHGPIARRRLPSPGKAGWTLLVQGVDLHDDRAADLLARFRFIADARLDDLMVSYASDGGGVGAHVDAYDVFLLQARGRRRWRIGKGDPRDFVPGLPLKVLRRFQPRHEWVLEPGDLLYLPPGVAHEGIAIGGDCVTCSIGFRAMAWGELVEPWLDTMARLPKSAGRYTDPGVAPTRRPARLPAALAEAAFAALAHARPTRANVQATLLTFLSEPKSNVVFARTRRALAPAELRSAARTRGLRLDRRTRMLYSGQSIAINGELVGLKDTTSEDRKFLYALADQRELEPSSVAALSPAPWSILARWHAAGWLRFPPRTPVRLRRP
jgi:50S ribosomal protein L16 3-hydroxylase